MSPDETLRESFPATPDFARIHAVERKHLHVAIALSQKFSQKKTQLLTGLFDFCLGRPEKDAQMWWQCGHGVCERIKSVIRVYSLGPRGASGKRLSA